MYKGIYISMTGMNMRENELSAITNNIANINTNGYKKQSFASKLYPLLSGRPTENRAVYQDARSQTYFGTQSLDVSQGSLKKTDNPLDLAIEGEGFLKVKKGKQDFYTRDGSLTIDKERFLVTRSGFRVLDENNNPVQVDGKIIEITRDGNIYIDGNMVSKLKIAKLETIMHVGESLYEGKESGQATGHIVQGWIETSNVNPMEEMVKMIQAIRNFEFAQRITTTFDQLAQKAVSEIARI